MTARTVPGLGDGAHQPHAPRDPNPLAFYLILAAFGLVILMLWGRS